MDTRTSRANVHRLLHALVPFLIMISLERGIVWEASRWFSGREAAVRLIAFLAGSGAAVLFFRLYRTPEGGGDEPAVGALRKRPALLCVPDTVLAFALLAAWMYAAAALTGGFESESGDWNASVPGLISLLALHPLIEEFVFRRMFYGELRLMSPIFGALAQAVMFAISHSGAGNMIYALGAGMILGVLYERTGAMWCVVTAHALINLRSAAYLAWPLLADSESLRLKIDIGLFVLGFCALAAVLLLRGHGKTAENGPDGGAESAETGDEEGDGA